MNTQQVEVLDEHHLSPEPYDSGMMEYALEMVFSSIWILLPLSVVGLWVISTNWAKTLRGERPWLYTLAIGFPTKLCVALTVLMIVMITYAYIVIL